MKKKIKMKDFYEAVSELTVEDLLDALNEGLRDWVPKKASLCELNVSDLWILINANPIENVYDVKNDLDEGIIYSLLKYGYRDFDKKSIKNLSLYEVYAVIQNKEPLD